MTTMQLGSFGNFQINQVAYNLVYISKSKKSFWDSVNSKGDTQKKYYRFIEDAQTVRRKIEQRQAKSKTEYRDLVRMLFRPTIIDSANVCSCKYVTLSGPCCCHFGSR